MGKGKGSFEYWSCRVKPGKVIMEVGGGDIREEIAKAGKPVPFGIVKFLVWRRPNSLETRTSPSPPSNRIHHPFFPSSSWPHSYSRPCRPPFGPTDTKQLGLPWCKGRRGCEEGYHEKRRESCRGDCWWAAGFRDEGCRQGYRWVIVSYAILLGSLVLYVLFMFGVLLQAAPLDGLEQTNSLKVSARPRNVLHCTSLQLIRARD